MLAALYSAGCQVVPAFGAPSDQVFDVSFCPETSVNHIWFLSKSARRKITPRVGALLLLQLRGILSRAYANEARCRLALTLARDVAS